MSKIALIWSAITAGGAAATTGVLVATGVIDVDRIFSRQETAPAPLVSQQGAPSPEKPAKPEKVAATPPAETPQPAKEEPVATPETAEKKPSFDIVRVEPSGDAVVAGQSEPGAIVALLSDGKVVGKTLADKSGAWTVVLDKPLEPGEHDISAANLDKQDKPTTQSDEHVAVSVPKDKPDDLLVVMSKPGEPTKILQKPAETVEAPKVEEPKTAEKPTVVAAVEPTAEPEPKNAGPAKPEPVQKIETPEPAAKPAAAESKPVVAEKPEPAKSEKPVEQAAKPVEPAPTPAVKPVEKPQEPKIAAAEPVKPAEPAEQPKIEPAKPKITYSVSVEAVETEDGALYVAGAGTPGTTVRVYIDGKIAGTAEVNDQGRWLMQTNRSLEAGRYSVRADSVADDSGAVVARAEVPFEREAEAIVLKPLKVASGGSEGDSGTLVVAQVPSVIIRKGDNLWRISRRRYGHGVRYTTIYGANKDQIRNPHLIYPGQVFMVPAGDVSWSTN